MRSGFGIALALLALSACSSTEQPGGTGGQGADAGSGGSGALGGGGQPGGNGGSSDGGAGQGGAGGSGAGTCEDSGTVELPAAIAACDGLGPGTEDCHYRIIYEREHCCPEAPCDRLLIYWAGGNQTCDEPDAFDGILGGYADAGFVTACAQPYTTEQEGGAYPYHEEFARMNRVTEAIRNDVATVWDGSKLLIGGNSHGGTAPLVAIASRRALTNHAALWTGSTHTAVLLNDGISNPRSLEEWTGSTSGCGLMHQRFVGRYNGGSGPLIHSCSNNQCYCSNPPSAGDWALDTVVIGAQDPTSPYVCADFEQAGRVVPYRFTSCSGSGASPCGLLGDIIPDDQQLEPYQALAACSGVDRSYEVYASCSHVLCGGWQAGCGAADSLTWLQQQGW